MNRNKYHPLARVCKGLQYVVYQKSLDIMKQNTNNESYLDPVDTIQRPRLPMTGRVENTGQRNKRYSTSTADDAGTGLPISEDKIGGVNKIKEDTEGDRDYTDDKRSHNNADSKTNNKDSSNNDFKERHKSIDSESSFAVNESNENTSSTRAATMRKQYHTKQVESIDEKIYEDLEEAMFSSSSDDDNDDEDCGDGDDEADVERPHGLKDEQSTAEKTNKNGNSQIDNPKFCETNNHLRIPSPQSTSEALSDDSDNDSIHDSNNPSYFALNRSQDTVTLSNRILSETTDSQKDDDSHNYDEPYDSITTTTLTSGDVRTGENSNESESIYEVVWREDDQTKPNLNHQQSNDNHNDEVQNHDYDEPYDPDRPLSPVAIQVIPNTPHDDDHSDATDAPLPDRFSPTNNTGVGRGEDSEYSDLGEEFEENNYEGLKTEFVKPPEYSDPEKDSDGGTEKSRKPIKIGNDTYEALSFDNNDENLYEELDTFNAKNGSTMSDTTLPTSQKIVEDESVRTQTTIPIDTFYLKKLDSIIQEIRFGIGKFFFVKFYFFLVLKIVYHCLRDRNDTGFHGLIF